MHIVDFRISNYKSFHLGPHTPLSPGFNVIIGRNNVGKTAMIEALSLRFRNNPHRSPGTMPRLTSPVLDASRINILFEMEREEFAEIVTSFAPTVYLPTNDFADPAVTWLLDGFHAAYDEGTRISLSAQFEGETATEATITNMGITSRRQTQISAIRIDFDERHHPNQVETSTEYVVWSEETLPLRLARAVQERVYTFRAERLNVGESGFGYDPVLRPDASNLAQALNHLQTNPARLQRFNALVHVIFPDVTQITVQPTPQHNLRILVWSIDPTTEREDLAIPLSDSGTGIGQVLAMLYVVLTSEFPRIIIIDEPQSFLHPGAVRKLMEVMRREARHEHQYIVSTHSPAAVTAAAPSTLLLVRKDGAESSVELVDPGESQQTRLFLAEIGARLADVFGADNILWVEGPTEERCFPLVIQRLTGELLLGTEIIGVRATGELEGRQARAAFEIYRRLSAGRGLLPPAVGFIFDREGRRKREQEDLIRQAGSEVHFLPRRMYENYLLNPAAIAAVANSIEGFVEDNSPAVTVKQVKDWLDRNSWRSPYFDPAASEERRTQEVWQEEVHGAKVLTDLFNELSGARVRYEKVIYGVALTQWLLENSPPDLEDLGNFLRTVLSSSRSSNSGIN